MASEDQVDEPVFDLGPGDLAVVVRSSGESEVYLTFEPGTEDDEDTLKSRLLADFILFAITDDACKERFALTRLN